MLRKFEGYHPRGKIFYQHGGTLIPENSAKQNTLAASKL